MVKADPIQTTDTILMVSPDSFSFNNETAGSNSFQNEFTGDLISLQKVVLNEFNGMVNLLRENDVNVIVLNHTKGSLPDAVFPNNWFSTDSKGNVIIYPMLTKNRRKEKDIPLLKKILKENNFSYDKLTDFSNYEKQNLILEGTGSLIWDRTNNAAFAIESNRTKREMFELLCVMEGIPKTNRVFFHALDESGNPIYHTNVIMSIGSGFAVICDECIRANERDEVVNKLTKPGLEAIKINYRQLNSFCGNILNIRSVKNESLIMMSSSAYNNFEPGQLQQMEKYGRIIHSDINTIENIGGGSARCMMAEIFLNKIKV